MTDNHSQISTYLKYLPAIFQEADTASDVSVLGKFLLAFEHVLTQKTPNEGVPDNLAKQPALGEILNTIHLYFDPRTAPVGELRETRQPTIGNDQADFLTWLASWVGLTLRDDWTIEERTRLISQIIPLYRLRGTKEGLRRLLAIYTENENLEIFEFPNSPYYFQVGLTLYSSDPFNFRVKEEIARAIIDQEKPAHTYYDLQVRSGSTIQIGNPESSILGVNTLLGSQSGTRINENNVV